MPLFGPPNVARLAEKGDAKGLIHALSYERDAAVRAAAAQALAKASESDAIAALAGALEDADARVRLAAAQSLAVQASAGDLRLAVEPLCARLTDDDESVAQAAARALGASDDPRSVEPLLAAAESASPYLRERALAALAELAPRPEAGAAAIQRAVALLTGADEVGRERGRMLLGRMGAAALPAVEALRRAENRDTRWRAIEALERMSGETPMPALLAALSDTDFYVREAAKGALVARGEAAVSPLLALLAGEGVALRQTAVECLERLAPPVAAGPLKALLQKPNAALGSLRRAALGALGAIAQRATGEGDIAARDQAIAAMSAALVGDDDATARRKAAEGLAQARERSTLDALVQATRDTDEDVRRIVGEALRALGWEPSDDEAGAAFWVGQKRWDRCLAMGAPAVSALLQALARAIATEQRIIRTTIERIGAPALPALLAGLNAPEKAVRAEAAGLMGALAARGLPQPDEALAPLCAALNDSERDVRAAAAGALGLLRLPEALPALLTALGDMERPVQKAAGQALAALGELARAPLVALLAVEDWRTQRGAMGALGLLGGPASVAALLPHLGNADTRLHQAASEALIQMGAQSSEALVSLLEDEDEPLRLAAIVALGAIRDPRTVRPLLDLLWDPSQPVRAAAMQALQAIGLQESADAALATNVNALYVLVCVQATQPEDGQPEDGLPEEEWRALANDALMDLQGALPALERAHVRVLSDFRRLHQGVHSFVPSERTFRDLEAAFQVWVAAQGGVVDDWERRFFHRELLDPPELDQVDCILVYYATGATDGGLGALSDGL